MSSLTANEPLGNPNNKASLDRLHHSGRTLFHALSYVLLRSFVIHHRAGPRAFGLSGASPDG